MKKTILYLVLCFGLCLAPQLRAASKKQAKKAKTEAPASTPKKPPLSKYDKLFKGKKHQTATSRLMTLHLVGDKLYFELPTALMGKDMLLAATTTATGDNAIATNGYKAREPLHIRFTQEDSLVMMRQANTRIAYDATDERIRQIAATNYIDPILEKYAILAYSPDSLRVVIDVTALFMGSNDRLSPISEGSFPIAIRAVANKGMSRIEAIKAFDDNISVRTAHNYNVSVKSLNNLLYADRPVAVTATRSLILLPEIPMRERISDARVGIFLTNKQEISNREDQMPRYSLANRWRLTPCDTAAFVRGELTEPACPIVFYVDSLFPESWKAPIREGILRWNKAFEAIGFRNAVQVRDFPADDPQFDPDNIRYSCIRYVPSTVVNAMGPSWTDPRTGEIINASVLVYNDLLSGLNAWRFVQTAAVDERVRAKKMTDAVRDESLAYVVSHEVGHCLGLMHNMAASAAYPVDSLRSASFTQQYGTTPSIMDYARFNYIAQPGDRGVRLTPPDLGLYDYFAIKWLYSFFPAMTSAREEAAELEKWVDAKAGDPVYRYGKQQMSSRYDPSALEEDLGDDPIKAADYGIANLRLILAHLDEWISDDPDYTHRQQLHRQIVQQYGRYLNNVLYSIGGIYLNEAKAGTPVKRFAPVPRERQRASLKWLVNQLRTNDWIDNEALCRKEALGLRYSAELNNSIAQTLTKIYMNVTLSSYIAEEKPYTVAEYFADLYDNLWEPALRNRPLTTGDKILQKALLKMAGQSVSTIGGRKVGFADQAPAVSFGAAYAPSVREILLYGLDEKGLCEQFRPELERAEQQHGSLWLAEQWQTQFGYGYGWQNWVRTTAIDESPTYYYDFLVRSRNLLKQKAATGLAADRAHYRTLLFTIGQMLCGEEGK